MSAAFSAGFVLLLVFVFVQLYFMPFMICKSRNVNNSGALLLFTLLLGWTGIGWIICMVWAIRGQTADQDAFYKARRRPPLSNTERLVPMSNAALRAQWGRASISLSANDGSDH